MKHKLIWVLGGMIVFGILFYSIIDQEDQTYMSSPLPPSFNQKVENMLAFTRIYGYVKYFHPSEEVEEMDWKKFAIYGSEYVIQANDTHELKKRLEHLFQPIAPTVKIYFKNTTPPPLFNTINLNRPNLQNVAWQRVGRYEPKVVHSTFKQRKIFFTESTSTNQLFDALPSVSDVTDKAVNNSLRVQVPLVLYATENNIAGATPDSKDTFRKLQEKVDTIRYVEYEQDQALTLGGVVILWNDIQHFYPYKEDLQLQWLERLPTYIKESLLADDEEDYNTIIQKMTSPLQDGYINLPNRSWETEYRLPFAVEESNNKTVITDSQRSDVDRGDILLKIGEEPIEDYLNHLKSHLSGSPQLKQHMALQALPYGEKGKKISITIKRGMETIRKDVVYTNRNMDLKDQQNNSTIIKEIEKGIYYVNLSKLDYNKLTSQLDVLANAQGIIFDLRGRTTHSRFLPLIRHFSNRPIAPPVSMKEQIIYPDHKNLVGYEHSDNTSILPLEPFFKGKKVFLTDATVIGKKEAIIAAVKENNLGQIVGTKTGGTVGEKTYINVPNHDLIGITGVRVQNPDGSQLHGIGISPTILVNKSIQGIKNGKDEVVEKALELMKFDN